MQNVRDFMGFLYPWPVISQIDMLLVVDFLPTKSNYVGVWYNTLLDKNINTFAHTHLIIKILNQMHYTLWVYPCCALVAEDNGGGGRQGCGGGEVILEVL